MRWSTFRTPDRAHRVGVWRDGELFPMPGAEPLVALFGADGELRTAGDEAVRGFADLQAGDRVHPEADLLGAIDAAVRPARPAVPPRAAAGSSA